MLSERMIEELNKNKVVSFCPSGISMWPFIRNNKNPVVIALKTDRLNMYDVALFVRDNGNVVLHRVIEVTPDGYVVRGDSQFFTETVTRAKSILIKTTQAIAHGLKSG